MLTVQAYLDLERNNAMTRRIKEAATTSPHDSNRPPQTNYFEVVGFGRVYTAPKKRLYIPFQFQLGDPLPETLTSGLVSICHYQVSLDASQLEIDHDKFDGREIDVVGRGTVIRSINLASNAQVVQVVAPTLRDAMKLLTHVLYDK